LLLLLANAFAGKTPAPQDAYVYIIWQQDGMPIKGVNGTLNLAQVGAESATWN
jgi:hypothetical protein